jgi:methylated-DNA-protein-cysteine methyltransferase-like protein
MPRGARAVGWSLRSAPHADQFPCHRVVNRVGCLSGGWHWGHPDVMAALLRAEGVPFLADHQVDLAACLWLPDENENPPFWSDREGESAREAAVAGAGEADARG